MIGTRVHGLQLVDYRYTENMTMLSDALWIAQILLAAGFLVSGAEKLFDDKYSAFVIAHKTSRAPRDLAPFIGVAEIAGAAGLVLRMALEIAPALTAWAAVGPAAIMLLAMGYHLRNREPALAQFPRFLLSAFVAWGLSIRSIVEFAPPESHR